MRALNLEELEQRKRKVLQFVIHEYIRTGKPVGSKALAVASRLGLSSASIRHVLAELEKDDLVNHPHTSAGRIPTDKGYRLYVDSLIELQRLAVQEEQRIHSEYERRIQEVEELMSQTSRILSSLSHYTGFVMMPKFEKNVFSRMELVPISEHRILVAMITESGLAKNFVVNLEGELPREKLYTIARLINRTLKGLTLQEVQMKMIEKLEDAQQEYREAISLAKEIGQEIRKLSAGEFYMDGARNILSLPDFSRTEELHNLFRIVEEKQLLANLLEDELGKLDEREAAEKPKEPSRRGAAKGAEKAASSRFPRVHVSIGSEHPEKAMQNLSLVSSTYQLSDHTVGVLGIIGPKRMEYSKMIALVDYISRTVNEFIRKIEER